MLTKFGVRASDELLWSSPVILEHELYPFVKSYYNAAGRDH